MRRIYFLVPDISVARRIVDELLLARVDERHLHVLAMSATHDCCSSQRRLSRDRFWSWRMFPAIGSSRLRRG